MKKLTKLAVLAAGAALAVQGAYAAGGDLVLGINNNDNSGSTGNDYEFDFGSFSTLQTDANVVESLGVTSSTLISDLGTVGPAVFSLGVTGGKNGSSGFIYITTADNGTGTPTQAGSVSPVFDSSSVISTASGTAKAVGAANTAGTGGTVANTLATSFTYAVAKDYTTTGTAPGGASVYGELGASPLNNNSPMALLGASGKITLDLWEDTVAGATLGNSWVYEGDIVVDLSGTTATYDYDPVSAVPEPSTYGIIAGAGLLILCLGGQLRRKTA